MSTQGVTLTPYWSNRHKTTSYAVGVEGTSQKLFFGIEDLRELRDQINLIDPQPTKGHDIESRPH